VKHKSICSHASPLYQPFLGHSDDIHFDREGRFEKIATDPAVGEVHVRGETLGSLLLIYPEDGDGRINGNVGNFLLDYTYTCL
jgi:hypothetical protein